MDKKKIFTPKLRFKEFQDNWKEKPLGALLSIKSGIGIKANKYAQDGIRLLQIENVSYGTIKWNSNTIYLPSDYLEKHPELHLKKNDIVLALNRPVTNNKLKISKISKLDEPSILYQRVGKLIFKGNDISSDFIYQIFTRDVKKFVLTKSIGSDQPFISINALYKFKISIPAQLEQQKIAYFLSAFDERILLLNRKKELLEQYKKGVIQQLFSGKLRFKDKNGKTFPKWEEKKLGAVAERVIRKNKENNLNVLTISAQQGLISQLEYFNKSVSAKDVTNYYLLYKGDFAYNKSYSTGFPMGAIKRLIKYEKGVVSTLYICFKFNENVLLSFMEQYFENGYQNAEIEKVAQEGARNHGLLNIGVNDFFNISLTLPSIQEQEKISNCLSCLDIKIENANKQITQTQNFKKGLLQQMLV